MLGYLTALCNRQLHALRVSSSENSVAFAGIRELNLRGLPIELDDLMLVVKHLPSLCVIHLSGAQKLPPGVSALFSKSSEQPQAQGMPCNLLQLSASVHVSMLAHPWRQC